jgi:general secretion pathway protein F
MKYKVRALSSNHELVQLTVFAQSESEVLRHVENQGLTIASIELKKHSLPFSKSLKFNSSSAFPLILLSQELLALLTAGLSLVESIEALVEKEIPGQMHATLIRILNGLKEGKRFSTTLVDEGVLFPSIYIGLIKSAEGTSDLPQALKRFIDYQSRIDHVRNKIISASVYPLILLIVGGLVTLFLIGYVVPKFAAVYQGTGRDLPWMSQILLNWGHFASQHIMSISIVFIGGLAFAPYLLKRYLSQLLAFIVQFFPSVHERIQTYELSKIYLTLGMLLEGGIPLNFALNTAHEMSSTGMQNSIHLAQLAIESGHSCSTAFEENNLTTSISLRLIRVGERTGQLGGMLIQSATFYESEMNRWIERFTKVFEPLLMVLIGLVVGTIVVLLYLPIFDLAGNLS